MAAPIVYRWDDASAPSALGNVKASMCNILNACLVTGYGAKAAAGWTRPYANGTLDECVFRNNSTVGNGMYLRVTNKANTYGHDIRAYEAMTDYNVGTFPFHANPMGFDISAGVDGNARPWILIADNRAFYFFCWVYAMATPTITDIYVSSMFFGDIVSRFAVDAYGSGLLSGAQSGSFGALGDAQTAEGSFGVGLSMPRRYSGVAASFISNVCTGGGPTSFYMGGVGLPYTPGDQIIVGRPYLNDGTAYTFRGYLPGLYYPCHNKVFGQLETITTDGHNFLGIRHYSAGGYEIHPFISLNDWRA